MANSGKSNSQNNDILDLKNVRGKITSDKRDTIYIVSDFAQYNSVNLNSKFYENVIINYQDKQITCINFDINMKDIDLYCMCLNEHHIGNIKKLGYLPVGLGSNDFSKDF